MAQSAITYRGYGTGSFDAIARRGYAAYTSLPQPPAAGYTYVTCTTTTPPVGGLRLGDGGTPAVAVGDIAAYRLTTLPASYAVSVAGDFTVTINTGADLSRQKELYAIWRLATLAFDPASFPVTTAIVWDHEVPPVWAGAIFIPASFGVKVGTAITPIVLQPAFVDSAEGDTLTFLVTGGALPPGLILVATTGVITGTPTVAGTYTFTITAFDITGEGTASPLNTITIVQGFTTILNATIGLSALNIPIYPQINYAYSNSIPNGFVISQSPIAGSTISPGSSVQLTVSMGAPNPGQTTHIPNVVGQFLTFAQQSLTAADCDVGGVTYQASSIYPSAMVFDQFPAAGGPVPPYTAVDLVVSSGPAQIYPNTSAQIVPPLPND